LAKACKAITYAASIRNSGLKDCLAVESPKETMKQNKQQTYMLEAAAQENCMSRCHLSKLVERGDLPSHAAGALRLIDVSDLELFELRREIDRWLCPWK
jgi:hypothetical protein